VVGDRRPRLAVGEGVVEHGERHDEERGACGEPFA
jgi:hypothetical protein